MSTRSRQLLFHLPKRTLRRHTTPPRMQPLYAFVFLLVVCSALGTFQPVFQEKRAQPGFIPGRSEMCIPKVVVRIPPVTTSLFPKKPAPPQRAGPKKSTGKRNSLGEGSQQRVVRGQSPGMSDSLLVTAAPQGY